MCDDLSGGSAADETARIPADCPLARAGSDASTATFALLLPAARQQQHLQQQDQSHGAGSTVEEGETDCASSSCTLAAATMPEDSEFDFSDAALAEANATLASGHLPGGLRFMPVSARCGLRRLCKAFKVRLRGRGGGRPPWRQPSPGPTAAGCGKGLVSHVLPPFPPAWPRCRPSATCWAPRTCSACSYAIPSRAGWTVVTRRVGACGCEQKLRRAMKCSGSHRRLLSASLSHAAC